MVETQSVPAGMLRIDLLVCGLRRCMPPQWRIANPAGRRLCKSTPAGMERSLVDLAGIISALKYPPVFIMYLGPSLS
jgi:hypothetical protein